MSDTPNENLTALENTTPNNDEEIRAKLLADGVEENDITPELIIERREVDGRIEDTAMMANETLAAWRRRLNQARESLDGATQE
jgi:hypothetical protein